MKRIITLIITILLTTCLLSGCGAIAEENDVKVNGYDIRSYDFKKESLVYDIDTLIVYIENHTYHGRCVYTQYLSENGLPYKYVDGKFVEIVE